MTMEFRDHPEPPATPAPVQFVSDSSRGRNNTKQDIVIHSHIVSGLTPRRPEMESYTSHARSVAQTSSDGRLSLPPSRSPSPSPPQSPILRSHRPRPISAISLPDHHHHAALRRPPIVSEGRWSYDRERMPASPVSSRAGSKPETPLSEHDREIFEEAFSQPSRPPSSILVESRASSRPPSIILNGPTELGWSHAPGDIHPFKLIPTAAVPSTGPPNHDHYHEHHRDLEQYGHHQEKSTPYPQPPQDGKHHRTRPAYHILTEEEMEMLSHPPPIHPPMTMTPSASPPSSRPSTPRPLATKQQQQQRSTSPQTSPRNSATFNDEDVLQQKHEQQEKKHLDNSVEGRPGDGNNTTTKDDSGCFGGRCSITPARQIAGTFGAWFIGMAMPITFGLLTGCIGAGCR
ncbi:hypothetical protein B0J18DRAFT_442055 [Chaetomium sp. MPI-SDFR-AT-0129]|nr:hypothetical protein B0J18DRAFT_442055 [Chaetomium sp. MPI-SDFR-AT-0129]